MVLTVFETTVPEANKISNHMPKGPHWEGRINFTYIASWEPMMAVVFGLRWFEKFKSLRSECCCAAVVVESEFPEGCKTFDESWVMAGLSGTMWGSGAWITTRLLKR